MTGQGDSVEAFANLDLSRVGRTGSPEVVYGEGKTPEQIESIVAQLLSQTNAPVLVTRASPEQADRVNGRYDPVGRTIIARSAPIGSVPGSIAIVTAGTTDLPVALEASGTLEALGIEHRVVPDIGVAGLHRSLRALPDLQVASVCIVVAGMDGALPSVLAGLLSVPLIAVPTSVGYGASFEGLAALLVRHAQGIHGSGRLRTSGEQAPL